MSNDQIARDGPFKLEMEIWFEVIDGEHRGMQAQATVDLKPGIVPTDDDIKLLIAQSQKQLGDGYALSTRHQFVRDIFCERMGVDMNVAIPGPNKFRLIDGETK